MKRIAALIGGVLLAACGSLPRAEKVEPLDAGLRSAVAARSYAINPSTTRVRFAAGPTPAGRVEGDFTTFNGVLSVGDAEAGMAELSAVLDMTSARLPSDFFRSTLLGPGWFEVEMWPEASFRGRLTGWNPDGTGQVSGIMTIRDISHEESFPLVLTCDGVETCPERAVGFMGNIILDRTDYGMTRMLGLVGRDVQITVSGQLMVE